MATSLGRPSEEPQPLVTRPIPTPSEIRSAGASVLREREMTGVKVVKLGSDLVVKYGVNVSLQEGETMEYLARHSKVPIAKLLAMFSDTTHPASSKEPVEEHFLVMEYIPGQTLESLMRPNQEPGLTRDELLEVGGQIRAALTEMRSQIPFEAPGYFGSVNHRRLEDGLFYTQSHDPSICGPFDSEQALHEGLLRRVQELVDEPQTKLLRSFISEISRDRPTGRPVFTHADLQPKNIMVQRLDAPEQPRFRVTLIDWELSGWYPEWWEFATVAFTARFQPEWHALVQDTQILTSYPSHFAFLALVRAAVYW